MRSNWALALALSFTGLHAPAMAQSAETDDAAVEAPIEASIEDGLAQTTEADVAAESLELQTDEAADTASEVMEITVTATPIRDSLEASINAQRAAVNVVNVIESDTIGRFPDQTAAAALARHPGIAVQRDQGQERFIQVRGGPARWTQVSFDGINVLGAQDRVFRFDSVPAALIGSVELSKTLTPEMSSEALAGRVNINTFSALDNPGWNTQLEAGYGYIDLADGPQESYSGRVAWSDGRFGAVVAASHFEFEQQADNAEPAYDATGIRSLRAAKYVTIRETNAYSGKFEFLAAPGHRLSFTSLYTEFKDDELRNQYTFNFAGAASGTRDFDGGDLSGVPIAGLFEEGDYENSTFYNVLRGEHSFKVWQANWQLAYTETEDLTDLPLVAQSASASLRPDLSFVNGPNFPVISIAGPGESRLDQDAFDSEVLSYFGGGSDSEAYTAKGDLQREWDLIGPSTLSFGFQYDTRESLSPGAFALLRPDGSTGSFAFRSAATALGVAWTPFDFITGERIDERFGRGFDWNYIDNRGMRRQLDTVLNAARAANAAGTGNYALPTADPSQAYQVDEDILAGYVMNKWQWGRHGLLAGVRIEQIDVRSVGNITTPGAAGAPPTRTPLAVDNSFTDFFPSVHWNVDLTDTLKYRLSGVTGAARPSFNELRANANLNDGTQQISGGNPELEPETAYGADTSIEWYFAKASLLAANAFYRDVDKVLFESTTVVGNDRYNFGGVDRSVYEFNTTLNGEDGELYGVEFTYNQPWTFLPPLFEGLGMQASVSFLDGSFTTPDGRKVDFPGTSDRITNVAMFYENYDFSIRLGYQHRTDWLDDISSDAQTDTFWEATERLDLSVRYDLTRVVTLYMDANNLTDELGIRYAGDESRPTEVESFGRRYLFGLRASF
ncbi:MAG: TonB-dependent receptor [Panacagrimonas sp.]